MTCPGGPPPRPHLTSPHPSCAAPALKSHIHMNSARWRWLRACSDRFGPLLLLLLLHPPPTNTFDSRLAPSSHHLPLASFRSCLSKAGALCLMPKCRTTTATTTTTISATTTAAAAASCLVNNINYLVYVRAYVCVCGCGRGTALDIQYCPIPCAIWGYGEEKLSIDQLSAYIWNSSLFAGYLLVYPSHTRTVHCCAGLRVAGNWTKLSRTANVCIIKYGFSPACVTVSTRLHLSINRDFCCCPLDGGRVVGCHGCHTCCSQIAFAICIYVAHTKQQKLVKAAANILWCVASSFVSCSWLTPAINATLRNLYRPRLA